MFNLTEYIINFNHFRENAQGANGILMQTENRWVYPLAMTLSFAFLNYLMKKIIYSATDNSYIYNLCVQKHKNKRADATKSKTKESELETSTKEALLDDQVEIQLNEPKEQSESELNSKDLKKIQYHLWFYRYSVLDCLSSLMTFPFIIRTFLDFNSMHNDYFTFVKWDTYIIQCIMMGNFINHIDVVCSEGHVKPLGDLLIIHHLIALAVFSYSVLALYNFPWISQVLFFEISSFFNRSNLVLKFHDPEQSGFLWNINSVCNFLAMIFIRLAVLLKFFVYDFAHYRYLFTFAPIYCIFIFLVACTMVYLAWTSLRYMIYNDLPKNWLYFSNCFNNRTNS